MKILKIAFSLIFPKKRVSLTDYLYNFSYLFKS